MTEKNGQTGILANGQEKGITFSAATPVFLKWDTLVFLDFAVKSNAVVSNQPRSKNEHEKPVIRIIHLFITAPMYMHMFPKHIMDSS